MIYLFYGSDVEKTRAKAFEWVAKARAKEPNLVYVRLAREELTPRVLEDAAHSGGLFVSRLLVLLDEPFAPARGVSDEEDATVEVGDAHSLVEGALETLAASDNAIIILAPKLATPKAKRISAKAKVEYKFDLSVRAGQATRGFNSALVDAFGARSREKLWLEINRALALGDAPEILHGLLHWKVRDLMAKGSRVWKEQDARRVSLALIELLQNSRRGGLALDVALEKFALSLRA
ncbi:MAG: hypothetical protein WC030_01580 [Candidatus Paceibacterota bacterium]